MKTKGLYAILGVEQFVSCTLLIFICGFRWWSQKEGLHTMVGWAMQKAFAQLNVFLESNNLVYLYFME